MDGGVLLGVDVDPPGQLVLQVPQSKLFPLNDGLVVDVDPGGVDVLGRGQVHLGQEPLEPLVIMRLVGKRTCVDLDFNGVGLPQLESVERDPNVGAAVKPPLPSGVVGHHIGHRAPDLGVAQLYVHWPVHDVFELGQSPGLLRVDHKVELSVVFVSLDHAGHFVPRVQVSNCVQLVSKTSNYFCEESVSDAILKK